MAPFPYMPMAAILASMVSSLVVQMSVFSYAGFMVEYLGVVDDKDKAGESETHLVFLSCYLIPDNSTCCTISCLFVGCSGRLLLLRLEIIGFA